MRKGSNHNPIERKVNTMEQHTLKAVLLMALMALSQRWYWRRG